jgi:hypothetical protein
MPVVSFSSADAYASSGGGSGGGGGGGSIGSGSGGGASGVSKPRAAAELMRQLAGWLKAQRMRVVDLFNRMDKDRDTHVSLRELSAVFAELEVSAGWTEEELRGILAYLDTDGNGSVGLRELQAVVQHASTVAAPKDVMLPLAVPLGTFSADLSQIKTRTDVEETDLLAHEKEHGGGEGKDDAVDYRKDGRKTFYTDENVLRRLRFRRHPHLLAATARFWNTFASVRANGYLSKAEYYEVQVKLCKALFAPEDFTVGEAREAVEADWADANTVGLPGPSPDVPTVQAMGEEAFFDSMFETIDIWTESIELEEYVAFALRVYERIAVYNGRDKGWGWRMLADVRSLGADTMGSPRAGALAAVGSSMRAAQGGSSGGHGGAASDLGGYHRKARATLIARGGAAGGLGLLAGAAGGELDPHLKPPDGSWRTGRSSRVEKRKTFALLDWNKEQSNRASADGVWKNGRSSKVVTRRTALSWQDKEVGGQGGGKGDGQWRTGKRQRNTLLQRMDWEDEEEDGRGVRDARGRGGGWKIGLATIGGEEEEGQESSGDGSSDGDGEAGAGGRGGLAGKLDGKSANNAKKKKKRWKQSSRPRSRGGRTSPGLLGCGGASPLPSPPLTPDGLVKQKSWQKYAAARQGGTPPGGAREAELERMDWSERDDAGRDDLIDARAKNARDPSQRIKWGGGGGGIGMKGGLASDAELTPMDWGDREGTKEDRSGRYSPGGSTSGWNKYGAKEDRKGRRRKGGGGGGGGSRASSPSELRTRSPTPTSFDDVLRGGGADERSKAVHSKPWRDGHGATRPPSRTAEEDRALFMAWRDEAAAAVAHAHTGEGARLQMERAWVDVYNVPPPPLPELLDWHADTQRRASLREVGGGEVAAAEEEGEMRGPARRNRRRSGAGGGRVLQPAQGSMASKNRVSVVQRPAATTNLPAPKPRRAGLALVSAESKTVSASMELRGAREQWEAMQRQKRMRDAGWQRELRQWVAQKAAEEEAQDAAVEKLLAAAPAMARAQRKRQKAADEAERRAVADTRHRMRGVLPALLASQHRALQGSGGGGGGGMGVGGGGGGGGGIGLASNASHHLAGNVGAVDAALLAGAPSLAALLNHPAVHGLHPEGATRADEPFPPPPPPRDDPVRRARRVRRAKAKADARNARQQRAMALAGTLPPPLPSVLDSMRGLVLGAGIDKKLPDWQAAAKKQKAREARKLLLLP